MPWLMLGLGYGFILLGVAGIVLPILPGWIFVFVGLVVLTKHAPWAGRLLEWFKRRHPKARELIDRAEGVAERCERRVEGWFRRA